MMSETYADIGPSYSPRFSHHVGTIGERIEIAVTVKHVTSFTRPCFGSDWQRERVYVVTMRDAEGNTFVSKSPNFSPPLGARVVLRCTVKAHQNWKGEQQTVVFRVKEMVRR